MPLLPGVGLQAEEVTLAPIEAPSPLSSSGWPIRSWPRLFVGIAATFADEADAATLAVTPGVPLAPT